MSERVIASKLRAPLVAVLAVLAGALLAAVWSYTTVDGISEAAANALLGYNAKRAELATVSMALAFAFATGVAGTCTACNVGAFAAVAPLAAPERNAGSSMLWLLAGVVPAAALYGGLGAVAGSGFPQLSMEWIGGRSFDFPLRLVQSSVAFAVLGLVYVAWALGRLGVIPDLVGRLSRHSVHAEAVILGATIGLYLVGRPFPLFIKLFQLVVEHGRPGYGALAFALQGLGSVVVVVLLSLALSMAARRWAARRPDAVRLAAAGSLLAAGTFYVLYWGVRVPLRFVFAP